MSDAATHNLLKRLHYLRNRAPREFNEMALSLNEWAGSKLTIVTTISPDQLVQFQGQMQAIEEFLTILKDSETKPID